MQYLIKKLAFVAVFCSLFVANTTFAAHNVNYTDPLKSIVVSNQNPEFVILVQSNPTTGYSWALKNYDSNLIAPVSRHYYPPANKKLMGAGGYEKWTFRVKAEGFIVPQATSISMLYSRPFDQQGAQVTNFRVVTHNDN
jgi:inhibitor of cysteine peptidase